ncbi:MAG TPA: hypothetical protein VN794_04195, partial [Methylomirabilota bacterium]|nr:hypothetical protein [Methylomirabilota bacterium]
MNPRLSPVSWLSRPASLRCARLAVLGLALVASCISVLGAEKAARPNILFIMSDDHAAHAMSCYGSRINKTPNLDRIA